MWTDENRQRYNRDKLRYPSDLTDDEWSEVKSLIGPAKRGGRRRKVDVREVVNGVLSQIWPTDPPGVRLLATVSAAST